MCHLALHAPLASLCITLHRILLHCPTPLILQIGRPQRNRAATTVKHVTVKADSDQSPYPLLVKSSDASPSTDSPDGSTATQSAGTLLPTWLHEFIYGNEHSHCAHCESLHSNYDSSISPDSGYPSDGTCSDFSSAPTAGMHLQSSAIQSSSASPGSASWGSVPAESFSPDDFFSQDPHCEVSHISNHYSALSPECTSSDMFSASDDVFSQDPLRELSHISNQHSALSPESASSDDVFSASGMHPPSSADHMRGDFSILPDTASCDSSSAIGSMQPDTVSCCSVAPQQNLQPADHGYTFNHVPTRGYASPAEQFYACNIDGQEDEIASVYDMSSVRAISRCTFTIQARLPSGGKWLVVPDMLVITASSLDEVGAHKHLCACTHADESAHALSRKHSLATGCMCLCMQAFCAQLARACVRA